MESIGTMLIFLTVILAILLCLYHWKIIYAAMMTFHDEILHVYRIDVTEQHTFTLPPLPFIMEEQEGTANPI